jgi:hypothetical protein
MCEKTGETDLKSPQTHLIEYLSGLGREFLPLILEYSRLPLGTKAEDALIVTIQLFLTIQIFVKDRPTDETLPSKDILAHLKQFAVTIVPKYLEHIVMVKKETDPEFHNELIFSYLDTAFALKKNFDPSIGMKKSAAGSEPGLLGDTRRKLLAFLSQSNFYNPEKILANQKYNMDGNINLMKFILISLDLLEEKAIVLSKIGSHSKALKIYAIDLGSHDVAEAYCERHYQQDKEGAKDVFLELMKVYLVPTLDGENSSPRQPSLEPALKLLSKHYLKIDIPKVPINVKFHFL